VSCETAAIGSRIVDRVVASDIGTGSQCFAHAITRSCRPLQMSDVGRKLPPAPSGHASGAVVKVADKKANSTSTPLPAAKPRVVGLASAPSKTMERVVPASKEAVSTRDLATLASIERSLAKTGVLPSDTLISKLEEPALAQALLALGEAASSADMFSAEEIMELTYEQLRDDVGKVDYTSPAVALLREIGERLLSTRQLASGATRAGEGVIDFGLGVLDGLQPNPNAPRTPSYFAHAFEHTVGQIVGASLGLAIDTAGFAAGLAGIIAPPVAAVATVGVVTPIAASVSAASAALLGVAIGSGKNHAQHLGEALQTSANEIHSEGNPRRIHRDTPRIEDGNSKEGWQHIDERHVSGTNPGGDLFPKGVTRDELLAVAIAVVRKGARRKPNAEQPMQVFEKRIRVKSVWCDVRVVVNARFCNRVITMFPLKGTCK
jgi:hypothetical protein